MKQVRASIDYARKEDFVQIPHEMSLTNGIKARIHDCGATLDFGPTERAVYLPLADLEEMVTSVRLVSSPPPEKK